MLLGVDAGNFEVKLFGTEGPLQFPANLGEYRDRRLKQPHGKFDIEYEYAGQRGFAGTLALYESEFSATVKGDTKAHKDALLRILIGLHLYGAREYSIVVGQPIDQHTETEKQKMIDMVYGKHAIAVNGDTRSIAVHHVAVAPEGGAAYWSLPLRGLCRIIDIGSGTVNLATLMDGRYIDRDSFTLRHGTESTKTRDLSALVRAIYAQTSSSWQSTDAVRVVGGTAEIALPLLQVHYPAASVLYPHGTLSPSLANAVGNYTIAKRVFSK